jgi:IclR family acetate operon transcriptional repressor
MGPSLVADEGTGMARRYRLGMELARLGDLAVSQVGLRDVAMPALRELTDATSLTSRVAVLRDGAAIVIGQVDAAGGRIRFAAQLGRREGLHCSAVGKAILAALPSDEAASLLDAASFDAHTERTITDRGTLVRHLAEAGRQGYAIDDEEDVEGIFCVGAAVLDRSGRPAGAVSVTGLKLDQPAWRIHRLGETVREHAGRVSALLGAPETGDRGGAVPRAVGS